MTSFRTEFPDYPVEDMPTLPQGWVDQSWHNDACPSFISEALGLTLWIDYRKVEDREMIGSRFLVCAVGDNSEALLASDDWDEVEAFIARRERQALDEVISNDSARADADRRWANRKREG